MVCRSPSSANRRSWRSAPRPGIVGSDAGFRITYAALPDQRRLRHDHREPGIGRGAVPLQVPAEPALHLRRSASTDSSPSWPPATHSSGPASRRQTTKVRIGLVEREQCVVLAGDDQRGCGHLVTYWWGPDWPSSADQRRVRPARLSGPSIARAEVGANRPHTGFVRPPSGPATSGIGNSREAQRCLNTPARGRGRDVGHRPLFAVTWCCGNSDRSAGSR